MTTDAQRLQTQQELAGDLETHVYEAIRSALMNVHTAMPGIVRSVNLLQQTVSVQPAIRRVRVDGTSVPIGVCQDVPVVFPGGALTFDIAAGDECLLVFSERCIDRWWASGGVQDPAEVRFHDYSDGFAFIGAMSLQNLLSAIGAGTELRLRDGSCRVAIRNGMVYLGSATASGAELIPAINGVVLGQGIEPVTKLTYYQLGAASLSVVAKR